MTVILGRPSTGNNCRIITTASLSESKDVTFPVPAPPTKEEYDKTTRITLPTPDWVHYVQGVVALMGINVPQGIPPFEAVVASCVPLGGGVSSSAALEVATCLFIEELCRHGNVTLPTRSNAVRSDGWRLYCIICGYFPFRKELCCVRELSICTPTHLVV